MGVLARVFEAAGMATVGISLVRRQAENIKAPRFLHCEFPLGRPLGKPLDAPFQSDVIRRAFALLDRTDVPVIEDHPDVIEDEADEPVSCILPPRLDPTLHPAIDEAMALRPAYNRHLATADGRTAMGRIGGPDQIADLLRRMIGIAEGASLEDVGFDINSVRAASQDIRAYYEESALAIADSVPAARQVETWIYSVTKAGTVIRDAARALKASGAEHGAWYFLLPANQA